MAETPPGTPTLAELDPDAARAAVRAELSGTPGLALRADEAMARHTPLRCGGPADLWAEAADLGALRAATRVARRHGLAVHVCWPFQDLLVRDGGLRGLALLPGLGFEEVERLPADAEGPARLRLGAAAPWAAARRATPAGAEPGPCHVVAAWPGCPGAFFDSGPHEALEGLVTACTWLHGRGVERVEVAAGGLPPALPKGAVPLTVEVPLAWPPGSRRLKHRKAPPRPGTLFAEDDLPVAPQLQAAGLLGARLRTWRLSIDEPGTLVHLGGGDCQSALVFARGVAEHALKTRGVRLTLRLPVLGVDGPRRRRPTSPPGPRAPEEP